MKTIAVIEDDLPIGDNLEALLRQEGYGVLRAYSGTEALYLLSSKQPDLVLLDLMLPGLPGEAVLPRIHGIPVIVLSAKGDVQDKVSLLRSGAVDYVTKPFHPQELLARIAAHLRAPAAPDAPLSFASLRLDSSTHTVSSGSKSAHLTKTESAILKLLMQNPNQALKTLTDELFRYALAASVAALSPQPLELRAALEEALLSCYGALHQRGITPALSLPDRPVRRTLDPEALSRILHNILSNALKYSDGDLSVTMTEEGVITFRNAAQHLTPIAVGRLFDRYYTVESAQSSTGLGLSIAKALTERMGGRISAAYEDGNLEIRLAFP